MVMERYHLSTKRAAVNFALRTLAAEPLDLDVARRLRGSGWDGDLGLRRKPQARETAKINETNLRTRDPNRDLQRWHEAHPDEPPKSLTDEMPLPPRTAVALLGHKRSLALREFALSIEALERFVAGGRCTGSTSASSASSPLESEPVDPRIESTMSGSAGTRTRPRSGPLDRHVDRVAGEGSKVGEVAAQHIAAGFGHGDHEGVDRGPLPSVASKRCCPSRDSFGDTFDHIACLEEAVHAGIRALTAREGLNEDHRWHDRRPEAVTLERPNHGQGIRVSARQPAYPSRIEDQGAQIAFLRRLRPPISAARRLARVVAWGDGSPTSLRSSSTYRSVSARSSWR